MITALPDALRAAQAAFERTGGLHAAGLFETDGRLVAVREDVGRHNALDKLIGSRVRARELPLWDRILMVSGRVSFEIVQKAAWPACRSSARSRRRRTWPCASRIGSA